MNVSELRIGNWVKHNSVWSYRNHHEDEFEFQIELADFYAEVECTLSIEESLQSIPITEDWLLKFGFKVVTRKGEYITYSNRTKRIGIYSGYCIMRWHGVKFNYVHQLQNLYFALTGAELQTKQQ